MTYVRRNVWTLGGDWADPILWYARGVASMQKLELAEPTSWRFYAGIHGFDEDLWTQLGYFDPSDRLPSPSVRNQFWDQCQHGSWYFLPWHRGYLLAFEANVRAAVRDLGGPPDWALPYWNYFSQPKLPAAFASPNWPDGVGNNPLYVAPRYGPNGDGNVFVPLNQVDLRAMTDPDFTGGAHGGSTGFGGIDTGFSHGGRIFGRLESQPHNAVHDLVGGFENNNQDLPGAMSVPQSAGLDPIFWLHHANIDRLWESWNQASASHADPTDPQWVNGPASIGERDFAMPMPDGTTWTYTPGEMTDLTSLGYRYDNLTPGRSSRRHHAQPFQPAAVGVAPGQPAAGQPAEGEPPVSGDTNVELVGASTQPVSITGGDVQSHVRLDSGMRSKVAASLSPAAVGADDAAGAAADRVFLNLENVRGQSHGAVFQVYVGVPDGEAPTDHPELLAGTIAPFGLRKASTPDNEHGGDGLTFVLEITDIVDHLHLSNSFDVERLPVRIVPMHPVSEEAPITIGRISIFRQGR
ncbi:MAG TPA: tyrosinase family protein [Jatrophihabitans sp.]|nr:tyrosinase family protein [Jatrophihabitans sp.]